MGLECQAVAVSEDGSAGRCTEEAKYMLRGENRQLYGEQGRTMNCCHEHFWNLSKEDVIGMHGDEGVINTFYLDDIVETTILHFQ